MEVQFFMSKYSKEIKEKVISLFEKELSPFRIAMELELPEGTVRNWLYKFNLSHNLDHKIGKQVFSADFKRKVLETRWKDKLSFEETAELFSLDNPSLIAAWQKRYLEEGIFGLQPKLKGRPPMKTKKEMREIAKPNRAEKKSTSNCHRKIKNNISSSVYAQILWY